MELVAAVAETEREDRGEDPDPGHLEIVTRAGGQDQEIAGGEVEAVAEGIGGGQEADIEAEVGEVPGADEVKG